jgi:hypothetical protein
MQEIHLVLDHECDGVVRYAATDESDAQRYCDVFGGTGYVKTYLVDRPVTYPPTGHVLWDVSVSRDGAIDVSDYHPDMTEDALANAGTPDFWGKGTAATLCSCILAEDARSACSAMKALWQTANDKGMWPA